MTEEYASLDDVIRRARRAWRPPPQLSLSEWADEYFVLSAESAAEPGRWKTLPYQKGIMDAITDPDVFQVSVMKSARVGYTLCMSAAIGYFIHQDPCSMLVVQPTVDDAKEYSKETIAPMLRDVPVLSKVTFRDLEEKKRGTKDSSMTLTHKAFPGGVLSLIGANSGSGFRRKSRRVVMFDEVDAYPPSAGSDGDPIRLGMKRAETFWNRKIIAGSTPLLGGASRIAEMFESGDQRRYYVPCPHCGFMDFLTFREGERGHWMSFDSSSPEAAAKTAHFICRGCGCAIEHKHQREMIKRGEWRSDAPFHGHASFHLWAAYSYSPGATWAHIAAEFVEADKGGPEKLRTFVNTALGETWMERGEAPEWRRLYDRRETYAISSVPQQVVRLTAGVDVQKDRLVYEVVGWGEDLQSWSVEIGIIPGETATPVPWRQLDELLSRTWQREDGAALAIRWLAVDSGFNTQTVYDWARRNAARVIACKGVSGPSKPLLDTPKKQDVTAHGKRRARGVQVWAVGVDGAKAQIYGWLKMDPPTKESGAPYPPGYCHFPEYGEEYFLQLTAEHLVRTTRRNGRVFYEWRVITGRENHYLDARVYARAAAYLAGLDRHASRRASRPTTPRPAAPPAPAVNESAPASGTAAAPAPPPEAEAPAPRRGKKSAAERGGWLARGGGATVGRGSWLSRRR
jgi:terminase, large subunit